MSDRPRNQPPTAAEHAQLRAYLQARGLPAAQVQALVGAGPDGRTRHELALALGAWLRNRPKQ